MSALPRLTPLLALFLTTLTTAQSVEISIGVRETDAAGAAYAGLGNDGGSSGSIEWIDLDGQTLQLDGSWQKFTFVFDALPVSAFTGDGVLDGNYGTLEHIRIRSTGSTAQPMRIWIDDVDFDSFSTGVFSLENFEGYASGTEVMFQEPGFSGSTAANLVAGSTAGVGNATPFGGLGSYKTQFQFVNSNPTLWCRLTTSNATNRPNPQIRFDNGASICFFMRGLPLPATAIEAGTSCTYEVSPAEPPQAFRWRISAPFSAGYVCEGPFLPGSPLVLPFDNVNLGTSLGLGDDEIATISLAPFSFQMSDGNYYSTLDVDSNGKINAPGADSSDFTPSVAEFIATTCIAPLHADLAPNLGGDVLFYLDPAGQFANITWLDVPEFGESNAITFQVRLLLGAHFWYCIYSDITGLDDSGDACIVGISDGSNVDPGPSNLDSGSAASAGGILYEFWDANTPQDMQAGEVRSAPIVYSSLNLPLDGTIWNTQATGISPTAVQGFILVGASAFPAPTFAPLLIIDPSFDPSCVLTHQIDLFSAPLSAAEWIPGSSTATWDLDMTAMTPGTVGFPIKTQMIFVDPAAPFALPLVPSNGIEAVLGNL